MRSLVAESIIEGRRSSVLFRAGLCRGRKSLPCTRPNFAGGRSRPIGCLFWSAHTARSQSGACFGPRTLREANRVPVLVRAHCAKPIECLFWSAHTARSQSSACFGPRTLREANRAHVWVCAGLCRGWKVCSGSKCISSAFPITLKRLVRAFPCHSACQYASRYLLPSASSKMFR